MAVVRNASAVTLSAACPTSLLPSETTTHFQRVFGMLLLKSLLGGIIGAAAGAGVWAAVTFYSEREFGILAWLVGLLAGGCVYLFVRQDADTPSGLIAALCAAVAVGVGKWITMSWFIERDLGAEAAQEILSKGPKLLLERLDPLDLLFLGLAVFSAYRLGSGGNDD